MLKSIFKAKQAVCPRCGSSSCASLASPAQIAAAKKKALKKDERENIKVKREEFLRYLRGDKTIEDKPDTGGGAERGSDARGTVGGAGGDSMHVKVHKAGAFQKLFGFSFRRHDSKKAVEELIPEQPNNEEISYPNIVQQGNEVLSAVGVIKSQLEKFKTSDAKALEELQNLKKKNDQMVEQLAELKIQVKEIQNKKMPEFWEPLNPANNLPTYPLQINMLRSGTGGGNVSSRGGDARGTGVNAGGTGGDARGIGGGASRGGDGRGRGGDSTARGGHAASRGGDGRGRGGDSTARGGHAGGRGGGAARGGHAGGIRGGAGGIRGDAGGIRGDAGGIRGNAGGIRGGAGGIRGDAVRGIRGNAGGIRGNAGGIRGGAGRGMKRRISVLDESDTNGTSEIDDLIEELYNLIEGTDLDYYFDMATLVYYFGNLYDEGKSVTAQNRGWEAMFAAMGRKNHDLSTMKYFKQKWKVFVSKTIDKKVKSMEPNAKRIKWNEAEEMVLEHVGDEPFFGVGEDDAGAINSFLDETSVPSNIVVPPQASQASTCNLTGDGTRPKRVRKKKKVFTFGSSEERDRNAQNMTSDSLVNAAQILIGQSQNRSSWFENSLPAGASKSESFSISTEKEHSSVFSSERSNAEEINIDQVAQDYNEDEVEVEEDDDDDVEAAEDDIDEKTFVQNAEDEVEEDDDDDVEAVEDDFDEKTLVQHEEDEVEDEDEPEEELEDIEEDIEEEEDPPASDFACSTPINNPANQLNLNLSSILNQRQTVAIESRYGGNQILQDVFNESGNHSRSSDRFRFGPPILSPSRSQDRHHRSQIDSSPRSRRHSSMRTTSSSPITRGPRPRNAPTKNELWQKRDETEDMLQEGAAKFQLAMESYIQRSEESHRMNNELMGHLIRKAKAEADLAELKSKEATEAANLRFKKNMLYDTSGSSSSNSSNSVFKAPYPPSFASPRPQNQTFPRVVAPRNLQNNTLPTQGRVFANKNGPNMAQQSSSHPRFDF